jgi:hypothetical protein
VHALCKKTKCKKVKAGEEYKISQTLSLLVFYNVIKGELAGESGRIYGSN